MRFSKGSSLLQPENWGYRVPMTSLVASTSDRPTWKIGVDTKVRKARTKARKECAPFHSFEHFLFHSDFFEQFRSHFVTFSFGQFRYRFGTFSFEQFRFRTFFGLSTRFLPPTLSPLWLRRFGFCRKETSKRNSSIRTSDPEKQN